MNYSQWFADEKESKSMASKIGLAPFTDLELLKAIEKQTQTTDNFDPSQFFIPGWKGDSLLSKNCKHFNELIDQLKNDVQKQFLNQESFTKSLKQNIFSELKSFSEHKEFHLTEVIDFQGFKNALLNEEHPLHKEMHAFLELYSYRIAIIYFYKIRFISILAKNLNLDLSEKELFNPNSFITNIYKSGSSNELKTTAFSSNHYTWYRPANALKALLFDLKNLSIELSITEIIKNVSSKTDPFLKENRYYSHALSHKHFGLFLNSLILNLPIWIAQIKNTKLPQNLKLNPEALACRYGGDYLESLSLSHWLAQENNTYLKWDQIICPEFRASDFSSGLYLKICNELQFLTFLTVLAKDQGADAYNFVANTLKDKFESSHSQAQGQMGLLEEQVAYDRVILNLNHFPKNNQHHYLLSKIENAGKNLKPYGYIYIFSTQKLFVPSQKEKIENLMREYNFEICFNFEGLTGRGEIAPYLYVFSKRPRIKKEGSLKKQISLSFRISGELTTFNNFSSITDELQSFYLQHLTDTPPLYHKELNTGIRFEFYQDAIVEGRLVNSTSKDLSKITHPSFFKSFTSSCLSLDNFFSVTTLNESYLNRLERDARLGLGLNLKESFSYLLIIDQRISHRCQISLHAFDEYEEKVKELGTGLCQYFGLIAKIPHINLSLFNYFFNSNIGHQLVELTFRGAAVKYKTKLESLLIPRFFFEDKEIPPHLMQTLQFFNLKSQEILGLNPLDIKNKFNLIEPLLFKLIEQYSYRTFGQFLNFQNEIIKALDHVDSQNQDVDFSNGKLQQAISNLVTYPLLQHESELYLQFNESFNQESKEVITRVSKDQISIKNEVNYILKLYHNDQVMLEIYSVQYTIDFLEYLLSHALNLPLTMVLNGIHLPKNQELELTLMNHLGMKKELKTVLERIQNLTKQALVLSVTSKN